MAIDTPEVEEQQELPQDALSRVRRRGGDARRPDEQELLLAQLRKEAYETVVTDAGNGNVLTSVGGRALDTPDGAGVRRIEHRVAMQVRLYKPDGRAVLVPSTNVPLLLSETEFSMYCPTCNTDCGGAAWGCAKQPEPMYRQCWVCGRKVHEVGQASPILNDDENRIKDENEDRPYMDSEAKRNEHMWTYHKDQAAARGLPRPGDMR